MLFIFSTYMFNSIALALCKAMPSPFAKYGNSLNKLSIMALYLSAVGYLKQNKNTLLKLNLHELGNRDKLWKPLTLTAE